MKPTTSHFREPFRFRPRGCHDCLWYAVDDCSRANKDINSNSNANCPEWEFKFGEF